MRDRCALRRSLALGALGVQVLVAGACASNTDERCLADSRMADDAEIERSLPSPAELEAPAITELAYFRRDDGPRILVSGTDRGGQLESVWLDLFDDAGAPATIPHGYADIRSNALEIPTSEMDLYEVGTFFLELRGDPGLSRAVRRVSAAPQDRRGRLGRRHEVALSTIPIRSAGETCDARGFDTCADGLACSGADDVSMCLELDDARAQRCEHAPVVEPGRTLRGTIRRRPSLWDPPRPCVALPQGGRPEAVVRLHVPHRTPSLTIATVPGSTTFDSVLSVMDGCHTTATVLACNDDDPPLTSRVELHDVDPGDYVVVVDSLGYGGKTLDFELAITLR